MKNDHIIEINQQLSSIPVLEQKMIRLEDRIVHLEDRVKLLQARYADKSGAAEKLKKESFSTTLQRLIGLHNGQLNKKTEEMLIAKLDYEKEAEHLQDLMEERQELTARIELLKQKQSLLKQEMAAREQEILEDVDHDLFESYSHIQLSSVQVARQLAETKEALLGAAKVLESAKASLEELEKAEQWITSDLWGGSGLVSQDRNFKKIDHAQSTFNRLASQMKDLERDLSQFHLSENGILTQISSAGHMVEFWLDNIVPHQNISSILRNGQAQLRVLITQLDSLVHNLKSNQENKQQLLVDLEQEKENLLFTCQKCLGISQETLVGGE